MIRICFALLGTAYIHPDEHMQNGEITSGESVSRVSPLVPLTRKHEGDLLSYHTIRTWEWSTALPLRSIVPAFVTTGIPLWFAEFFFNSEQTYAMNSLHSSYGLFRGTLDTGNSTNIPFSTGTFFFLTHIRADW